MDLLSLFLENVGAAAVAVVIAVAAVGNYLRSLKKTSPDPVLAGVGGGLAEREQMERLIAAINRIADIMADKNTASINDQLRELAERIDGRLPPPRKR